MTVSFFAPQRTVLLVADEALYIYTSAAKGPRLIEIVPWEADNFEQNVATVISKDCGGRPVLILNDTVEQHYRKERVMRAGAMDRANILKRKLNVAFPNYPVRAAFALKEKAPQVDKDKKAAADVYIFAAIPSSKQFLKTMGAVQMSLTSIAGFCLLPVEASDMVKTLSAKLGKKGDPKTKWVVFIGQHKSGGLRQIVTKNGELALTRMTPIADNDSDSELWAGEVYQEFKATMSYLSRFGYQNEDGLDVVLVSSAGAGQAFESLLEQPCNFYSMTNAEAARLLGVSLGVQDDFRHADVLHVAWAGRKSRFILPMKAHQIDKISKPRQMAIAASALLFLGAAFLGYQLFGVYSDISTIHTDIDDAKQRYAQLDSQYQREIKRKEDLGIDIRLVQSSIAVRDALEKRNIKPLPLFNGIGNALGKDMRIDRVALERKNTTPVGSLLSKGTGAPQSSPSFEATLQMTYPSTTNIDKGNKEVGDLKSRLETHLPEHAVDVVKYLKDYEYVDEIVVETGDLEKKDVKQDFVAEIRIKGPVEND